MRTVVVVLALMLAGCTNGPPSAYPPLILDTYRPPQQPMRTGVICTTNSGVTICN